MQALEEGKDSMAFGAGEQAGLLLLLVRGLLLVFL